ncbi:MAG TPA: hypothetical protein VHW00_18605 [Thermoanaerobaculia bacterium]|nr:hypothetical protein [Thermoanaerobaculia bacterium]
MRHIALAVTLLLTSAVSAAEVKGVVRGAGNAPLRNAHVYVYAAYPKSGVSTICPNCYRDCGKREATGADGTFKLVKLDDTLKFELLAVADGYEPQFVKTDGADVVVTLNARAAGDAERLITGVVVDPKGKAVVGAVVEPGGVHMPRTLPNGNTVYSVGYGKIPGLELLSVTNDEGEFALKIPDGAGKLDVRVTARSYAPKIERELLPKQPKTIHVAEGALLEGQVLRNGKPVAGVPVKFSQRDRRSSNFLGFTEIGTDEKGRFAMPNLGTDLELVVSVAKGSLAGGVVHPKVVKTGGPKSMTHIGTLEVTNGRKVSGIVSGARRPETIYLTNVRSGESWTVKLAESGAFVFDDVTNGELRLGSRGVVLSNEEKAVKDPRGSREVVLSAAEGDLKDVKVYVIE